jgi:uncharacterized low-complexity protein
MKANNKLKLAGILLGTTLITATAAVAASDGKCGTGSCGDKKAKSAKMMDKAKDAKCGAGSCGDNNKSATKMMGEKDKKMKSASKSADAKCGAGKCG